MRILILWASLADYTIASFRQLASKEDVEMMLVFQPVNGIAPFSSFDLSFADEIIEDKEITINELSNKCLDFKPDIVLMASWNFRHYMKIAKRCKTKGSVVISSFDNQWANSLRQNIARIISPVYLKPTIDNFLVPGDRQAQLAYRLGYPTPLYGFYCANNAIFDKTTYKSDKRTFLFIGRLIEQKGVRILLESYVKYRKSVSNPWDLCIAGEGPLKELFQHQEGVTLKSFVQPSQLGELFCESSCFVLPSLHENWGLVIHEAALAGMPIISTYSCGATTWFLRDGQNGYLINSDVDNLTKSLINMHLKRPYELEKMSDISKTLGGLWKIDEWANYVHDNFRSMIK